MEHNGITKVIPLCSPLVYKNHPFQPMGSLHTHYIFFVYQFQQSARWSIVTGTNETPRETVLTKRQNYMLADETTEV